ncbi:hypothetical protein [Uliginosibacterium sp. 31-12]|uniref:hypothetical protein n=1 Tax=Uliginosibacterium sp. 31-12 TaxID=3062781 RepID=UPI0026E2B964|nr:hypothetical protein [Uliginosibacterium sp. 31-12]MDO6386379.1 hypothetical protein [Uliginosibacterium sp. 31-12]
MQLVSTEASPAPDLSFAHFLAGLAGMGAAGILLAWQPEALLTRWHPAALAAVHLFALAGLMPVMLGALLQFVPVACGLALPRWPRLDWLILFALLAGAYALAGGFLFADPAWLLTAGLLLAASLLSFLAKLLRALWQQKLQATLPAALRRNALAFAATVLLGLTLIGVMRFGWALPFLQLVDWHAQWGLIGWVGGLIISVSSVVVPMFHVSAPYPRHWELATRGLPLLLLAGGLASLAGWSTLAQLCTALLAVLCLAFGLLTGLRVVEARRGERDAFHWGWLAVAALSSGLALLGLLASLASDPHWGVAFGVLALTGLGGGTISVMLYRIVPFLIWLHWQRANKARARLPLLHQIVPERAQRAQLLADFGASLVLTTAAFVPVLVLPGAALLAASKLVQLSLLARAMHAYRQRLALLHTLPPRVRPATGNP